MDTMYEKIDELIRKAFDAKGNSVCVEYIVWNHRGDGLEYRWQFTYFDKPSNDEARNCTIKYFTTFGELSAFVEGYCA